MRKVVDILFEKLRIKHFLIAFVLSLPLSAYLLRQNNLTMLELRDTVLQVDEETGDIAQIEPHLTELANYVLNHMNTDAGRIELPGAFNAAVEELRINAQSSGSADAGIYVQAQEQCENPNIPLTARAQCIQDFVVANSAPGSDAILELEFPDKSLFTYSFASPTWSPDLAGFSVLLSCVLAVVVAFLTMTRVIAPLLGRIIDRDPLE